MRNDSYRDKPQIISLLAQFISLGVLDSFLIAVNSSNVEEKLGIM